MFENINLQKYRKKNIPNDCVICAVRPGLYLNQINIFQATFCCYHSNPPARPQFKPSKFFKILTIISNLLLVYGVINDVKHIERHFTIKQVLIVLEILFNTSTVVFNFIYLAKNKIKLQEAHGLMSLLDSRFRFGVDMILTKESARNLYRILLWLSVLLLVEEITMFCVALIVDNIDNELLIRMCILEICIFSNATLGLFCMQHLFVYKAMFTHCFHEIEKSLVHLSAAHDSNTKVAFFNKIQKLQRLYMCLRRNLLLNEDFFQPEIFITYSIDVCLLLIGYSYFALMFFRGEVVPLKFDVYLILKSSAVVIAFSALCYEAEQLANTVCHNLYASPNKILFPCRVKMCCHSCSSIRSAS
ncbi:uncharacterized protein [Tenebrio molitor]|jgi:hypothetical protein|uniref:uncharacterized protein n=1 Tax=Tenebrio molitor TaxID=7067 RepID=UPI003624A2B0